MKKWTIFVCFMSFKRTIFRIGKQLAKYSVTTLLGTGVDCLVMWVMSTYVFADNHMGQYVYSPLVSFECAVMVNYITAYFYVWKDRLNVRGIGPFFSHFWKYNISCISAFVVKMMILNVIGAAFKWDPVICNLIALTFSGVINFSLNEFVIFRRKEEIRKSTSNQE